MPTLFKKILMVHLVSTGDGVVGRKLEAGNIVSVSYLKLMVLYKRHRKKRYRDKQNLYSKHNSTVTTVSPAAGGAVKRKHYEYSIQRTKIIRFTKNRAITTNDFESLISSNFSGFKSVYVFGGENADPPHKVR